MGQFALGIRSLVVKSAIFVIMAALLAWALGGTLFPRPQIADFTAQAVRFDGHTWYWRVLVGGKNRGEVRWHLMREDADGKVRAFLESNYVEVEGPVLGEDGLYYAGLERDSRRAWQMVRVDQQGERRAQSLPDRLAAIQQMTRVEQGLPMQDEATIASQRHRVLDPLGDSADE